MPLTANQLARRNERVWASEVPMILGVSPWGSEWDCWVKKVGLTAEEADNANQKRMDIGHLMEEPLLQYASSTLGPITRNQERIHPDLPLGAHCDAIVNADGTDLEAKNIYFNNPCFDAWGDEGTDEVADDVIVQTHAHIMAQDHIVKTDHAHVVANVGGDFRLYRIPRSQTLCDLIAERVTEFWECVQRRQEPCGPKSLEVARRLKRETGKIIRLDGELAYRYGIAQAAKSEADKNLESLKAEILAAMGDAEIGDCGNDGQFTCKLICRKAYSVEAGESRQLRYKAGKK